VLRELNQSVSSIEFIKVYLKTNIAKYLPGNFWHYYGRIMEAKNVINLSQKSNAPWAQKNQTAAWKQPINTPAWRK
jgi:hypothetical protein